MSSDLKTRFTAFTLARFNVGLSFPGATVFALYYYTSPLHRLSITRPDHPVVYPTKYKARMVTALPYYF